MDIYNVKHNCGLSSVLVIADNEEHAKEQAQTWFEGRILTAIKVEFDGYKITVTKEE